MAYRAPDPDASAERALEEERLALVAAQFKQVLRIADFGQFSTPRPGPAELSSVVMRVVLLFPIPVLSTFGGCYACERVSEALGTAGDFAGGLAELFRVTAAGALGMVAGWLVVWALWRRTTLQRSRS